ncbi:MAG: hypothetical protein JO263_04955, partial [Candidatus Eremiobacteraeota bacterium]|nr:hypothetical protein [Candidatus Eremiobacteraeota bacterium]
QITPQDVNWSRFGKALSAVLRQEFDRAEALVMTGLASAQRTIDRRQLLGVAAALGVARGKRTAFDADIEAEVRSMLGGDRANWLLPVAAWWCARAALDRPALAREVIEVLMPRLGEPLDPIVIVPPIGVVLAAARLGDESLLSAIAHDDALWYDRTAWHSAQGGVARALALRLIDTKAEPELAKACKACDELGMTLFSQLARNAVADRDAAAGEGPAKSPRLTRRERQIAALVHDGKTNREIAAILVVSERTVEAHLSNLFGKLRLGSRTQLAAWFLKNRS